jgi:Zn-dependent protease
LPVSVPAWSVAVRFDPTWLLVAPVLVLSVVTHECAHGVAALACGDPTARDRGRITLNPLAHIDPIGTIVLPLVLLVTRAPIMLGWAKPVPIEPANFRDPRNAPVWVALAGPASNGVLALIGAALARLAPDHGVLAPLREIGLAAVVINLALGLFNLIPIPPLDGSWVLMRFLRLRHIIVLHQFRWVGLILVAALLSSPFAGPVLERPLRALVHATLGMFGVPGAAEVL